MFFYESVSVLDIFLLLSFLFYLGYNIYKRPELLILFIVFFNLALTAISFFLLELGAYITELGQYTYRTDNFIWEIVFLLIFVFFFTHTVKFFLKKTRVFPDVNIINRQSAKLLVFVITLVIISEFLSLFVYGSPLLDARTKVEYAIQNKIVSLVGSSATYIAVILGLLFFHTKKNKFLIIFLIHVFFLILAGQKFSSLVVNASFFAAPFLINLKKIKLNFKIIVLLLSISIVILFVFFANYSQGNAFSNELGISTWMAMLYRAFYLSAHPSWGVFDLYFTSGMPLIDWKSTLLHANKELVLLLSPFDTSESLEKGVTFGMSYPAYFLLNFSIGLSVIFSIIFSIIFGLITALFMNAVIEKKIILAVLLTPLINIITHVFIQGNFSAILSSKFFIICIFLAFYWLFNLNTGKYRDENSNSP